MNSHLIVAIAYRSRVFSSRRYRDKSVTYAFAMLLACRICADMLQLMILCLSFSVSVIFRAIFHRNFSFILSVKKKKKQRSLRGMDSRCWKWIKKRISIKMFLLMRLRLERQDKIVFPPSLLITTRGFLSQLL